jgi:DNA (cytosine-5)-methyltransferase 1
VKPAPRLLDLFCGAGGAAVGYHRAGFDIVGVDINPQPRYPFEFHQADALTFPLDGYDAIHASPPCQGYSRMRRLPWLAGKTYPMLLEPTWEQLAGNGVPWVIENVMDAPMPYSTVLCGWTFGLPIYRHRRFGASILIMAPPHRKHVHVIAPGHRNINDRRTASGGVMGVLPYGTTQLIVADPAGHTAGSAAPHVKAAMGIEWMTRDELTQAIPPAYTEHIGGQLLAHLSRAATPTASKLSR